MASSSMFTTLLQSLPSSKLSFRINSGITAYHNPVLSLLESKLANQLELLRLPEDEDLSYISVDWLHNAMSTVLFANSNAKESILDLQNALSDSVSYCKWLDECLDDNVRLLDTCLLLRESLSINTTRLSNVHAIVDMLVHLSDEKMFSKATLQHAAHAISKFGKFAEQKSPEMISKRSKIETRGSVLKRMGEKLHSLEDQYKGNGWGIIYVAHTVTIFICAVLLTAFSLGLKQIGLSTISISSQSNWSLELLGLQQKIKEEVDTKRTRKMPYLEDLENVEALLIVLGETIAQALHEDRFPLRTKEASFLTEAVKDLQQCSKESKDGLLKIEHDIGELYNMLVTTRMVLLDIYPKSRAIPRLYLEPDEPKRQIN